MIRMLAILLSSLLLMMPGPQTDEAAKDDFQRNLALGLERLRYGDLEGAREIFQAAVEAMPGDRRRLMMLAAVYREEVPPQMDRFEALTRQAFAADPASPLPLLRLASAWRDSGELDRAEAVAVEGLESFPDHPQLLGVLGTIRLQRGESGPAVRLLERATGLATDNPTLQRQLGLALAAEGVQGPALVRLQEARERAPLDLEVRRALVEVYRSIPDEVHAVAEEAAVRQLEELEARADARTDALRELSRRIDTLEIQAASDSPPAGTFAEFWNLAQRRGDLSWSLPRLERLAAGQPESREARAVLGLALAARGMRDAAGATLEDVLKEDPADSHALLGMTLLYAPPGNEASMLSVARRATEAAPDSSAAQLMLARALRRTGDQPGAVAALDRSVELGPERPDAYLELARARQLAGRMGDATRLVSRAAERFADEPVVHLSAGTLLQESGDDAGAIAELRRAQDLGGHSAELFRALGALAQGAGNPLEAAGYYRQSLAVNPNQGDLRRFVTQTR